MIEKTLPLLCFGLSPHLNLLVLTNSNMIMQSLRFINEDKTPTWQIYQENHAE